MVERSDILGRSSSFPSQLRRCAAQRVGEVPAGRRWRSIPVGWPGPGHGPGVLPDLVDVVVERLSYVGVMTPPWDGLLEDALDDGGLPGLAGALWRVPSRGLERAVAQ